MRQESEKSDIRKIILPELVILEQEFAINPFTIQDLQQKKLGIGQGALETLASLGYLFFNKDTNQYNVNEEGLMWIDINQPESEFVDGEKE